ncbi:MAG: PhzF family phenazine biosynthesis protein [Limisphaerales bacterium]
MRIPYYQVNAFTTEPFGGNPAGVCMLDRWLDDNLLQKIAGENNLSETAFFVCEGESFRLRWFTPTVEVDLCGHATLATAAVLFFELGYQGDRIRFETKSGSLSAARRENSIELDLPAWQPEPCTAPQNLARALGREPREVFVSRDYIAVFDSQKDVLALAPHMDLLMKLDRDGVIVTAVGSDADFVSRYFAPRVGIPEDPVTGSAHCSLIPLWAARLGKMELFARQVSRRRGELWCQLAGQRVAIRGNAKVYKRGELDV